VTRYDLALGPFAEFGFMRRALVGCLALALAGGPIGTFLVLRRMSLIGDALSHAVLPGAALGFILGGLSLPAMSLGGAGAGLVVALLSGVVTRLTPLREDASFAAFYLISLALGVLLVSAHGSNIDLLHLLFGSILAIDDTALLLIGAVASVSLFALAVIWRPLVVECFDPGFLRAVGGRGGLVHTIFLALVVLNLVAAFQALGTLMAVAGHAEVVVIDQPNALTDIDTVIANRRAVFELCERHRLGAATPPESDDVAVSAGGRGSSATDSLTQYERRPMQVSGLNGAAGAQHSTRASANIIEPAILINIAQEYTPHLSPEQLYERTRRYWVCSPEKRRPKPRLGISVARGVIHEVYLIDNWESYLAGEEIYPDADRMENQPFVPPKTRVGFFGAVSLAHAHYKGLSVAHLQRPGAQNPIMYLNC
jgi:zinc/manganese transport system permease protein